MSVVVDVFIHIDVVFVHITVVVVVVVAEAVLLIITSCLCFSTGLQVVSGESHYDTRI